MMSFARRLGGLALTLGLAAGAMGQEAELNEAAKPSADSPVLLVKREARPGDDELRRLMNERYNAAVVNYQLKVNAYAQGQLTLDRLYEAMTDVTRYDLDLCETAAEELPIRERHVVMAREREKLEGKRLNIGAGAFGDVAEARVRRWDAEVQLLQARRLAEGQKK